MKHINSLKRIFRYIFKGVPTIYTTAEIIQLDAGKSLMNKNILITGGGRGIGFFIAKKCINEGARVLIAGRNENTLTTAAQQLGNNCNYLQVDISDIKTLPSFIENSFALMGGRIDCLVNNASISLHEPDFRNVSESGYDMQFDINLKGNYFLTQYFIEKFEKTNNQSKGNILFISSERGSIHSDIPYGLSKAAINSLIGGLSRRLSKNRLNIRVNALAPGVTASDMTGRSVSENLTYESSPIGRILLPEEVAEVASFLLSDVSSCISGEIIHCDSGKHINFI
jgi:NAD(P)-dependent dehydrogenase (short-subunit alcohol dehydrogenase family)